MAAIVLRGVLCVAFESSAELLVSVGNESGHLRAKGESVPYSLLGSHKSRTRRFPPT